jgi:IS5 family transposase
VNALGVRSVAIPRRSIAITNTGEPSAHKIKWRIVSEGRINHLKRSYGWNRTELTGIDGARTWCGHGVVAHDLVKIAPSQHEPTHPAALATRDRPPLTAITSMESS